MAMSVKGTAIQEQQIPMQLLREYARRICFACLKLQSVLLFDTCIAAGQIAGELVLAHRESEPLNRRVDRTTHIGQFIDTRDEFKIFADRQVFPETKSLGHVTDFALDLFGLGAEVVAETGTLACVGSQKAAQHAQGRRLA